MKNKRLRKVTFEVEDEDYNKLAILSQKAGVPMTRVLRWLIRQAHQRNIVEPKER